MTDSGVRFICSGIFLLMLLSAIEVLAGEQQLGTVFYSAAEREALVARRHGRSEKNALAQDENFEQGKGGEEAPKTLPFAVSGIVSRSDGKSVVWLNGKPVAENTNDASLPSLRLSSDHVVIDGKSVKVGETLDIISGERLSPLPLGAVKVLP